MTNEEAVAVLVIMTSADGECCVCVRNLMHDFIKRFIKRFGFKDEANQVYMNVFGEVLPDANV